MDRQPLSAVAYRAKAAELRQAMESLTSPAAQRRAAVILQELERQAALAEDGISAEDGVLFMGE